MKLRSLALAVLGTAVLAGQAVPVKRVAQQMEQPDGSVVTLTPVGDEYLHYFLTTDNQMVLPADGAFYYAEVGEDGTLMASTVLAADPENLNANQAAYVANINSQLMREASIKTRDASPIYAAMLKSNKEYESQATEERQSRASSDRPWEGVGLMTNRNFPKTGSPKSPVILVEYQDVAFTKSDEEIYDYFYRMLTEEGFSAESATGSALDYFRDASNGLFTPEFDVYGPVTLPNNRAYYGGNDSYGNDKRAYEMMRDAVDILAEQGVDFSEYDTDGDKKVDNVFVYYAGVGEAQVYSYDPTPDAIWPHNSELRYASFANYLFGYKAGSVYINNYACSSELKDTSMLDGIGTFCHEFSHVLGLPDLYDSTYGIDTKYLPNDYSILDSGSYLNNSRTPPTYSAFERNALGWIDLVKLDETMDLTIENLIDSNVAYVATTDNDNEYYVFENRQRIDGTWDEYLPFRGMLIWHIDYNKTIWNNNKVNSVADHQRVDLVESFSSNTYSQYNIPWPGKKNVKEFGPETSPAFVSWSGESCGLALSEIANEAGEPVTLKVTNTAGIADAIIDADAPAAYYNLQGMPVANPTSGQIYILRQGSRTAKQIYQ